MLQYVLECIGFSVTFFNHSMMFFLKERNLFFKWNRGVFNRQPIYLSLVFAMGLRLKALKKPAC